MVLVPSTLAVIPAPAQQAVSSGDPPLRVGILQDWPPLYSTNKAGEVTGFAIEAFEAVAETEGIEEYRYETFSTFNDATAALRTGQVDIVPSMGITARRQDLLFTRPFLALRVVVFARRATPDLDTLGDLTGRRVAVVAGNVGEVLVEGIPGVIAVNFGGVREALFRLLAGEVDALVYPEEVVRAIARNADVEDRIETIGPPLTEVTRGIALRPGMETLQTRLDSGVATLLASPTFPEMYQRWFRPPPPFWSVSRVAGVAAAVLILAFFVMAVLRYRFLRLMYRRLEASENRFRTMVETLPLGVLVTGTDGRIDYANSAAGSLLRVSPEALIGKSAVGVMADGDRDSEENLRQRLGRRESFDMELRGADGGDFPAAVHAAPYGEEEGELSGSIVTLADLSESWAAREKIRFQASLLAAVDDAVISTDATGIVTYWNRAAERLYGYRESEALGRPVADLTVAPQSLRTASEVMTRLQSGETWHGQLELMDRSGRSFPAQVADFPIIGPSGELTGVIGISRDVSELRRLEQQLISAQRMESIGRLAGGVAHDFNNLLHVIQGVSQLAISGLEEESSLAEDLREISGAAESAAELTRQLLAFTRDGPRDTRVVDAAAHLRKMERTIQRLVGENIRLEMKIPDHPLNVRIDPHQLDQFILNLVVNAVDAMPDGGQLEIRATLNDRTSPDAVGQAREEGGRVACIEVKDTGIGMDEATQSRIFEPFYTTKEMDRGTGLGLFTAYGVVKQAGGFIDVFSRKGLGTTFWISLPIASEEEEAPEASRERPVLTGRILVVEDDNSVRQATARILRNAGHEVLVAGGAEEARRLLLEHEAEIEVLLTDVVMPGMSGPRFAVLAREIAPHLEVILMSGYSADRLHADWTDEGAILRKPVRPDDLLWRIDDALRSARGGRDNADAASRSS